MKTLLGVLSALTVLNTACLIYLISRASADSGETNLQMPYSYGNGTKDGVPLYDQPAGQQISLASVIFTVRYEEREGRMLGIVDRILKRTDGTEFYYAEGDHYSGADFEPEARGAYGEGLVYFCLGNPATVYFGAYIHGQRIPDLGGIRVEEFAALVNKTK